MHLTWKNQITDLYVHMAWSLFIAHAKNFSLCSDLRIQKFSTQEEAEQCIKHGRI